MAWKQTGWKDTKTSLGENPNISELAKKIYDEDEIKNFNLNEAINDHPLSRRPTSIRSKLAYKELLQNVDYYRKYLLPGQFAIFNYLEPKFKEDLEYYDKTPFVLFLGITRTNDGNIREIGLNLHYYPPHTRLMVVSRVYEMFKPWWDNNFNDVQHKPNTVIDWRTLKHMLSSSAHLAFGIKMYIPSLRDNTRVIPARLLSTAFYTEGNFSQATLQQIFKFWRQYR